MIFDPITAERIYWVRRYCTNCDSHGKQPVEHGERRPGYWVCPNCGVGNYEY